MEKIINFDMDGTLDDLYGVEDWLPKLRALDPTPYETAMPCLCLSLLAQLIHKAQARGWRVRIVSWLSKEPNPAYDAAVTAAKMKWLKKHLPSVTFDKIIIVPYGVPKHTLSSGVLFDDEQQNRVAWNGANESNHAYDESCIFQVLKLIAAGEL